MSQGNHGSRTSGAKDPRLESLERLTKLKEQVDKLLPEGETKPPESQIDTDDKFGYVAELVSYRTVKKLAEEIAIEVFKKLPKQDSGALAADTRVLLVDTLEYAADDVPLVHVKSLLAYFRGLVNTYLRHNRELINASLDQAEPKPEEQPEEIVTFLEEDAPSRALGFMGALPTALPLVASAAVDAVPKLLSVAADIAGYLRAHYSITGQDFDAKTEGLVAAVAGELRTKQVEVTLPNFYLIGDSTLFTDYVALQRRALLLKVYVQRLTDLKENYKLPQPTSQRLTIAKQTTDEVLTAFNAFSDSLTTQVGEEQPSLLAQAVIREKVHDTKIDYLLYLGNLTSGGEAITEDHLIRKDKVSFWGGIAAAFVLAKRDGEVIAANTLAGLSMFRHDLSGDFNEVRYFPFYRDVEAMQRAAEQFNVGGGMP